LKLISTKIRIPSKANEGAWLKLAERLVEEAFKVQTWNKRAGVREQHDLEQRILALKARPIRQGREKLIRDLQRQLRATKNRNSG